MTLNFEHRLVKTVTTSILPLKRQEIQCYYTIEAQISTDDDGDIIDAALLEVYQSINFRSATGQVATSEMEIFYRHAPRLLWRELQAEAMSRATDSPASDFQPVPSAATFTATQQGLMPAKAA